MNKFDELYSKILNKINGKSNVIKEGKSYGSRSYDDYKWDAEVNAQMYNNRVSMAKKIEEKYPKKTITKKCPVCGKESTLTEPDFSSAGDMTKWERDHRTWWNAFSEDEKAHHKTGICYDCYRKTRGHYTTPKFSNGAVEGNPLEDPDEDPEI